MQSIIADHARTKAEYRMLVPIAIAAMADNVTDRDLHDICRLTLEEYRALPE